MKKIYVTAILFILIIGVTSFIFYNSSKNVEATYNDSDAVVEMVKPIVDKTDVETEYTIDFLVRKAAHGIEFCLLGILVTMLCLWVKCSHNKSLFGFGAFYVLAVAVSDEYIQSFSGRTSSVEDIVIDFCGAAVGMAAVSLVAFIYYLIKQNIKKRRNKNETNQSSQNQS